MYLLHWPQPGYFLKSWKVLEELYKSGRVRAIGVSNFNVHHLKELQKVAEIQPMANEVECHPLLQQWEIRNFCKENKIQLIAHTPTGKHSKLLYESEIMNDISVRYHVSIPQIILRWHYQLGDISIPNTTNPAHLLENLNIWEFELTEQEMENMKKLNFNVRIWPDPDDCDYNQL